MSNLTLYDTQPCPYGCGVPSNPYAPPKDCPGQGCVMGPNKCYGMEAPGNCCNYRNDRLPRMQKPTCEPIYPPGRGVQGKLPCISENPYHNSVIYMSRSAKRPLPTITHRDLKRDFLQRLYRGSGDLPEGLSFYQLPDPSFTAPPGVYFPDSDGLPTMGDDVHNLAYRFGV